MAAAGSMLLLNTRPPVPFQTPWSPSRGLRGLHQKDTGGSNSPSHSPPIPFV